MQSEIQKFRADQFLEAEAANLIAKLSPAKTKELLKNLNFCPRSYKWKAFKDQVRIYAHNHDLLNKFKENIHQEIDEEDTIYIIMKICHYKLSNYDINNAEFLERYFEYSI